MGGADFVEKRSTQTFRLQFRQEFAQLQTEVAQSQSEVGNLNAVINLQRSCIIASQATIDRLSFIIQVFDINITTPITATGIYNIPVSTDAQGNSWFRCHDYYTLNGVDVCSVTVTYSITYWY